MLMVFSSIISSLGVAASSSYLKPYWRPSSFGVFDHKSADLRDLALMLGCFKPLNCRGIGPVFCPLSCVEEITKGELAIERLPVHKLHLIVPEVCGDLGELEGRVILLGFPQPLGPLVVHLGYVFR